MEFVTTTSIVLVSEVVASSHTLRGLDIVHLKGQLSDLLADVDLGASVAEQDTLLESARVETSVFTDLLADRVDLVPGSKGSGKSALYRIFVDFLPDYLLENRKVVVAHGVQAHGDSVFHAFKERFKGLDESDFIDFWCVYLISLAHEQFLKQARYSTYLANSTASVERFKRYCQNARIPEIQASKSLYQVLEWVLNAIEKFKPKVVLKPSSEPTIEIDLFNESAGDGVDSTAPELGTPLPRYVDDISTSLEAILDSADLQLWLMVDKLDEIFPRRSRIETLALRGLLRTLKIFQSKRVRIKVFLRDDILDQVTGTGEGFVALTHVTARQSDKLSWSEDQILTLVVNRLYAADSLCELLNVNRAQLKVSSEYRREAFYKIFPETVHAGKNQSKTLRWIYTHTMDGRKVVTPRDVIELLARAKQRQQDEFKADPNGTSDWIIGSTAIQYGLNELSERKKDTYLRAEFPHFWPDIEKFIGGKSEYSESGIRKILGDRASRSIPDLVSIGLLEEFGRGTSKTYKIPFLYRDGLKLTQGRQT